MCVGHVAAFAAGGVIGTWLGVLMMALCRAAGDGFDEEACHGD